MPATKTAATVSAGTSASRTVPTERTVQRPRWLSSTAVIAIG